MPKLRLLILLVLLTFCARASWGQAVTSFEGMDASQLPKPQYDVDPNGAIGTKQFMQWTNAYFQAYDKVTFAPVWSKPQTASSPWQANGITTCNAIVLDGMIIFDRLASRWVIAAHTTTINNYYYCVAVSSTDDLTSPTLTWHTYVYALNSLLGTNSQGNVYFPDWPKIGTWWDAYYVTFDLNDINQAYREVGAMICALDRTNMLINGTVNPPICFKTNQVSGSVYLGHSIIPGDVEGTTAPPTGRDEFLVGIENPVLDGTTKTSTTFNLFDFQTNWSNPQNSSLTQTSISEAAYQPGCYEPNVPTNTVCIPEPSTGSTGNKIDSVGDRFMPRMSYRNFGTYESWVVSHTVQVASNRQTGVRWYELRGNGSGTPSLYQDGNINPDTVNYRFLPSIAEDASGNAAVGYSISSASTHPGMSASYFSLTNSGSPTEISLLTGTADEENTWHWGSYSSMSVDPVDGCTFWYTNQYFPNNQTGSQIVWGTRIANFQVPGCGGGGSVTLTPTSESFGTVIIGSNGQATLTLNNAENVTLSNISVSINGSSTFTQTNNCGTSIPANSNCQIIVTFTPTTGGTQTATLYVYDSAAGSPQTASLKGNGQQPVSLNPGSLNFGSQTVGTTSSPKNIAIINHQKVTLNFTSIQIQGANQADYKIQSNTCGSTLGAGKSCTVSITFTPQAKGTRTASLKVTDNALNSPQNARLSGTGN